MAPNEMIIWQALYGHNVGRSVARGDLPTPEEYPKVLHVLLRTK